MWKRWGWLIRWGGTAAGIAYILHVVDFSEARTAFARISIAAIGVAIFGALVGSGRGHIVAGLHAASVASSALLLGAAALAWVGVKGAGA